MYSAPQIRLSRMETKIQQAGTTGERFVRQAYADLKATR